MNDLKFALRQLRKAPAFTITALATVAICLGANLAIFAVIDSILLRPLPFPQSDRLVTIFNTYPKAGVENDGSSITNYYERRGNIAAFSSLSLYREGAEVLGNPGSTEQVEVMRISPEFFATLGVNLAMGRTFTEAEAAVAENNGVIILTDAYWRQRLAADPNILGRDQLLLQSRFELGCVAAIDSSGRTIVVADAHRDDGKRFVVHADEKLTAFVELESATRG